MPSGDLRTLAAARIPTSMSLIKLLPSSASFLAALNLHQFSPISHNQAEKTLKMPSQTYDNVWVSGRGPRKPTPSSPPINASAVTAPAVPVYSSR